MYKHVSCVTFNVYQGFFFLYRPYFLLPLSTPKIVSQTSSTNLLSASHTRFVTASFSLLWPHHPGGGGGLYSFLYLVYLAVCSDSASHTRFVTTSFSLLWPHHPRGGAGVYSFVYLVYFAVCSETQMRLRMCMLGSPSIEEPPAREKRLGGQKLLFPPLTAFYLPFIPKPSIIYIPVFSLSFLIIVVTQNRGHKTVLLFSLLPATALVLHF